MICPVGIVHEVPSFSRVIAVDVASKWDATAYRRVLATYLLGFSQSQFARAVRKTATSSNAAPKGAIAIPTPGSPA